MTSSRRAQTKPVPEAASRASSRTTTTRRTSARSSLTVKFTDGSPLTPRTSSSRSSATSKIADPNGASSLLANMKSVEAPGTDTVVFHLKAPDATWPFGARRPARSAIVPRTAIPADKLQDARTTWSAPAATRSSSTSPGSRRCCRPRATATRASDPAQERHGDHPVLRQGLGAEARGRAGRRRHRLPQPLARPTSSSLKSADGVKSSGQRHRRSATSCSTWTSSRATTDAQKLAIRQAVAQTIDRQSIVEQRLQRHRQAAVLDGPAGPAVRTPRRSRTHVRGEPGRRRRPSRSSQRRRRQDARCRSRSGRRRRTTARPPATSTPRSSASSTTAGSST